MNQFLHISGCSLVTDEGLQARAVAKRASLAVLNVDNCFEVTDVGLQHLKGLKTLTHLSIGQV